jgi:sulfur relay (sulfurtransferase) complex TusBCD TusD component (DsrE family)
MPKWKQESLQFRMGLKQAKGDNYNPTKEERKLMEQAQQAEQANNVKCHICGRTFNPEAGKRHVAFCEAQAKKNQMKRR